MKAMNCSQTTLGSVDRCAGSVGPGNALFNEWCQHNCPATFSAYMNTQANGTLGYNQQRQAQLQDDVVTLFNTYLSANTITDNVTSPSYNVFQETLLDLCLNPTLPGICDKFLTTYCASYTREQAEESPAIRNFCGCYVPPDQRYLNFTKNMACDPLCHRALTVQKANPANGNILSCPQNICVINDTTINISNSDVNGTNIVNVCPDCGGSNSCLCIVSGTNVAETLSRVGVGTNIFQFCGGSSVCLVEDESGNIVSSSNCSGVSPADIPIPTFPVHPSTTLIVIVVGAILLTILVVITIVTGSS